MGKAVGLGWLDTDTYLSVSFAVPIQWYESKGDREISAQTASVGAGLDLTSFITRRIGYHVSIDLYFPQSMEGTGSEKGVSYDISSDLQDEWDSDWGISIFAGPSFALLKTERVLFALAPGFHWYMLFAEKGSVSSFQHALGVGANAELMFNLTRAVFLRAAVDLTWDFWGSEQYLDGFWTDYSSIDRAINFTPSVSVGIKL